jgi:hypothetical protein
MIEITNTKMVSQSTLVTSKKLNGDNQKITSENKNEIPDMVEQEIKEFAEFVSQLASSGIKIKY